MPSVTLPCPHCSTPLILDDELAGQEVACPECSVRLRMPATVTDREAPQILSRADPASPRPSAKATGKLPGAKPTGLSSSPDSGSAGGKSSIPDGRDRTDAEELRRMAAAAAAAGGAHSLDPDSAALPEGHHRTKLPTRRNVTADVPAPSTASAPLPAGDRPASGNLPTRRKNLAEDGTDRDRRIQPIEPAAAPEIAAPTHRGPSLFVKPPPSSVSPSSAPSHLSGRPSDHHSSGPPEEPENHSGETTDPDDPDSAESGPRVRGGFRLGKERDPHFTPAPTVSAETDAAQWGHKVENSADAARTRRFVSLGLLIMLLAIGAIGVYTLRHAFQSSAVNDPQSGTGSEAEARISENVMRNVEQARVVLDRFLGAETLDALAAEVRHPEETRPRMERFYGEGPVKPRKIRDVSEAWSEFGTDDREFIQGMVELDDFRLYPVILEVKAGQDPKLDWESFVSWSEIPWKDFLKSPPDEAVDFRVTLTIDRQDQYYNYYSKGREMDLICFKVEDPRKFGSCWAYCDKDSEAASKILFNLKRARTKGIVNEEGKTAITCMVKLRFPPEGKKNNQVVIEEFITDSWLLP